MTEEEEAAAVPATIDGAVIFSDLVGFTEFNSVRGDAAAIEVLDAHRAVMEAALRGCDGARVVKELGDGLLVWARTADAIGISISFLALALAAREDADFPVAVRVGVHCGPAQRRGDDMVGNTVNVAARIVDLAGPGEILLSDAVLEAAGADAVPSVQPIGPAVVKGVADPIWLHRIAGA